MRSMKKNPDLQHTLRRLATRAVVRRIHGTGRPLVVAHFVTNRCNCSCRSCLWKHNDWNDVPLDDLKRFYTEARAEGFMAVAISGGEPLLRKDLGELVRFLKQDLGMAIVLFTTGWFVKARMDEVLPHIDLLMLSIDSARRERHDAIRGLPGLFDRLMEAIDLVAKRYPRLPVRLNACLQQGIAEEIDELLALTRQKNRRISFDVITDHRNGADGTSFTATSMGLPPDELRDVCRKLLDHKRQGAPIVNSERYFQYFIDGRPGYRCHFPKYAMSVDGRGFVEDCLDLDRPIANIRETPLHEIMELPRFKRLRRDAESCSSCSSPTMVDFSNVWRNPLSLFRAGGTSVA